MSSPQHEKQKETSKKSLRADWEPTQTAKLNLFETQYIRANLVATVTKEKIPMDVAYALNEVYSGIY
ncbi:hypothetical protein EVAR_82733_1 [Eumeta japonica]|uniref:Uncharacterized protein n=1 Tax=Eumeta variegata TaxID=151549 RepID=A0A4C1ZLS1_EUMVA|nr:hypothetical protein EVAR_82733_1 [Eumeta japonica]